MRAGELDNRCTYTRGAYADVSKRARADLRMHTHHARAGSRHAFLSPYSSAYGDSVTHFPSLGITGTSAHHLPSTHIRNPPMGRALPASVDARYAPARACHTRRNLRDACGRSVLPMSPSCEFVARVLRSHTHLHSHVEIARDAWIPYSKSSYHSRIHYSPATSFARKHVRKDSLIDTHAHLTTCYIIFMCAGKINTINSSVEKYFKRYDDTRNMRVW